MKATILTGHVLHRLLELPDESVHCVVTSPPYWALRDYGTATWRGGDPACDHKSKKKLASAKSTLRTSDGLPQGLYPQEKKATERFPRLGDCARCGAQRIDDQLGLEKTPQQYLEKMVTVFREIRRVLRKDGTCWVNMGDGYSGGGNGGGGSFAQDGIRCAEPGTDKNKAFRYGRQRYPSGLKPKDLIGMPWRLAFALQEDGWYLRQDIIWAKPNPMPESVSDRCTKAHEYVFLLTKSARYFYDAKAIEEKSSGSHPRGPGNKTHRGTAAYIAGDVHHRTKSGLVAYAERRAGGKHTSVEWSTEKNQGRGRVKQNESFSAAVCGLVEFRNKRSVWEIATQPFSEAHYATFPEALVEPCILAGTSEKGCCLQCGAPHKRQLNISYTNPGARTTNGPRSVINRQISAGFEQRLRKSTKTITWKPTCKCNADSAPCIVLDPFCGSGTTGVVALRYGRNFLGIELNPENVEMARRRIHGDAPMFNTVEVAV
jgi:DNA modification methylase